MQKKPLAMGHFLMAILLVAACKHTLPDDGLSPNGNNGGGVIVTPPNTTNNCSPDTVYFANTISPLIASGCAKSGCHDAITHADGVNLTTYAKIMQYVIPGNAAASKLYKEIIKTGNDRMPPPPSPAFTAEQKAVIQKWINQGAKNNACVNCDTTDFKFGTAIKNIMSNKCQGCHNANYLGGGIDLSTYAAVKVQALNGKLLGSVKWATGYSPMPKNSSKLPDCEIIQIKKWIDAGALNN